MYPSTFKSEIDLRRNKIADSLKSKGIDAILICDNANLFYTSSRVFSGFTYITANGEELFFVRRPVGLKGDNTVYIRKVENIADELGKKGIALPARLAVELDTTPYNEVKRFAAAFPGSEIVDGSAIMRAARAVKTDFEVEQLRKCGIRHTESYHRINKVYREGMSDIELQIEIERVLRLEGSLGQFRISGRSMEIFMGNLLVGDNADCPTPYDFAMGGAGLSTSLPVGSNGTLIKRGNSVMVDMCGNFNGYMTDMTRTFRCGEISDLAKQAHQLSIDICNTLAANFHAGSRAADLYEKAMEMAVAAHLDDYFMGHTQKAGFVGHGVGIEVNEMPVLAPRSKDILQYNNVIAIEPKFVIPEVGAVGIENTYVVRETHLECLTNFPEQISELF